MNTYPNLIQAVPQNNHNLLLTFDNGEVREYDFTPHLSHKFYQELNSIRLFQAVEVSEGEIEWSTGQDFCPHTLYEDSVLVEVNLVKVDL